MKNLVEFINENHYTTAPDSIKEFEHDRANFEREIKDSQKKQKDYEKDLEDLGKEYGNLKGFADMVAKQTPRLKYYIAREKAEQVYAEFMINAITDIIKEMK